MDSNFRFRVPCKGRKAIIAGFGCMPPSVDYLRLPSVDITQGGLSEISEPKPYRARKSNPSPSRREMVWGRRRGNGTIVAVAN